jgi:hypothetical protein
MQPPSFGEWLIPLVLAGFAVITAWAPKMKLRISIAAYATLLLFAYGAYRYRLHEYDQWKSQERVVMGSHLGHRVAFQGGDTSQRVDSEDYAFFRIANLSNKRIRITHLWVEGCADNGGDINSVGWLPKSLEPADDYEIPIHFSNIHCSDWFNKGRARLTDGSIVRSVRDETFPKSGN